MAALSFKKTLKSASELIKTREYLSSGIPEVDALLAGGFVRGEISEVVGPASSGRTSLLTSVLAHATSLGEVAAYIDTFTVADPLTFGQAGVDLRRFLWIRCNGSKEKALGAADVLVRSGGFGVVILDFAGPDDKDGQSRAPSHAWFRLKQSLEGTKTTFLILDQSPVSGAFASLVLSLSRQYVRWVLSGDARASDAAKIAGARNVALFPGAAAPRARAALLGGLSSEAEIIRGKSHGRTTFYCDFHG